MNKVDEPNNITIVVVLVWLVVGILTIGIQVVYESCWRHAHSLCGGQRDIQLALLWVSEYVTTRLLGHHATRYLYNCSGTFRHEDLWNGDRMVAKREIVRAA